MWIQDILSSKTDARDSAKSKYNLPKRSKILIGVQLGKTSVTEKLLDGLSILPANFIIISSEKVDISEKNITQTDSLNSLDINSLDALVWECSDIKIESVMKSGAVPIVNCKNYLWKILSEFHPGRAEGNAYLYEDDSHWSVYYAIIRYLENHKFPYDNRNLVKNVLWV